MADDWGWVKRGSDWVSAPLTGMTHDDIAEIVFSTLNACHTEGIHDTLRQAHAVAVALLFAEADR